jgi:hypothetical protein
MSINIVRIAQKFDFDKIGIYVVVCQCANAYFDPLRRFCRLQTQITPCNAKYVAGWATIDDNGEKSLPIQNIFIYEISLKRRWHAVHHG